MSKIDELIKKYCPDGVEYKEIGEVVDYIQPTKYIVDSTKYNNSFNIPVLTAGQTFILGYTNEIEGIYIATKEEPVIIFDDFTTSNHWVDFNFKVKSSAMKILVLNKDTNCNFKYIYYAIKCITYKPEEHARQWISTYSKIKIPIPPLEVQEEIVKILDKFSSLTAELEAELEKRKQQYEYYRNQLLDFSENVATVHTHTHGLIFKYIKDIGKVCMCKRIMKHETSDIGDIPFYKIGTLGKKADSYISKNIYEEYKTKYNYPKKGSILISASGTIGRTVIYDGNPAYFQDSNIVWVENDEKVVINKFLYYLYSVTNWNTEGGTIQRLYNNNLEKIKIPMLSLETQNKIINILDKFDTLTNDLQSGLPAEIEKRRQQYEYYRNMLLTFKEKVS